MDQDPAHIAYPSEETAVEEPNTSHTQTDCGNTCNSEDTKSQQQLNSSDRPPRLKGLAVDRWQYCLRLNKAIYGLKQAPLAWYTRLQEWLKNAGFATCKLDPCVFYRSEPDKVWIYVHVNDIAIFGKNLDIFKKEINNEFEIKDMDQLNSYSV
ncbi:hypothetical protein O181_067225 [Austropuccinia psidii MF-1]|uniref:Reverse transcriptase Ty1/copia-type domain-containing protein n=1 Tax=Austropuccinia psidii MF-1 TaxID=1389203 RepID=A0A9Q3EYK0_9BASI|nr:hypothetical protein [Austropuccinia psidii MF-1]